METFDKIIVLYLQTIILILASVFTYDILKDKFGFFEEELSKYEVREGFRLGSKCTLYIGDDVEAYKESGCDCISSSKGFYCKPTEPTEIGYTPTDQMVRENCIEKGLEYYEEDNWRGCK